MLNIENYKISTNIVDSKIISASICRLIPVETHARMALMKLCYKQFFV